MQSVPLVHCICSVRKHTIKEQYVHLEVCDFRHAFLVIVRCIAKTPLLDATLEGRIMGRTHQECALAKTFMCFGCILEEFGGGYKSALTNFVLAMSNSEKESPNSRIHTNAHLLV